MKLALSILSLSFLVSISFPVILSGQDDKPYEVPGKFYISPDFGLVLGTISRIEFAPAIGYHITPRLSCGIGGRYEYFRQLNPFTRELLIRTDIYGIRGFGRIMLIPDLGSALGLRIPLGIIGHGEVEALSLENEVYGSNPLITEGRFWHTAVLCGGGISQQAGQKSFLNILVLWDLTNTSSSPYINPVLRFGIQFYL